MIIIYSKTLIDLHLNFYSLSIDYLLLNTFLQQLFLFLQEKLIYLLACGLPLSSPSDQRSPSSCSSRPCRQAPRCDFASSRLPRRRSSRRLMRTLHVLRADARGMRGVCIVFIVCSSVSRCSSAFGSRLGARWFRASWQPKQ